MEYSVRRFRTVQRYLTFALRSWHTYWQALFSVQVFFIGRTEQKALLTRIQMRHVAALANSSGSAYFHNGVGSTHINCKRCPQSHHVQRGGQGMTHLHRVLVVQLPLYTMMVLWDGPQTHHLVIVGNWHDRSLNLLYTVAASLVATSDVFLQLEKLQLLRYARLFRLKFPKCDFLWFVRLSLLRPALLRLQIGRV